jgi:hypothetical protein
MGQKKTLIILGHLVSEQAGMKYCAEWLRSLILNVPSTSSPLRSRSGRLLSLWRDTLLGVARSNRKD